MQSDKMPIPAIPWMIFMGVAALAFVVGACTSRPTDGPRHAHPSTAISAPLSGDQPHALLQEELQDSEVDPHLAVYLENRFPSAETCGQCHPDHYEQWSVSPHAYAQLSPVFNAMQGTMLKLMNGTTGDFCIRCHTPVGMTIGEPIFTANANRHPVSIEGVTCIVCHRMNTAYGKDSGRRRLVEGSILEPIFGPMGGSEIKKIIEDEEYDVSTDPNSDSTRKIHGDSEKFFQLTTPAFCGTCHDVTLPNGFRLEEAFSEYKTSPAADRGERCQDCHMGKELGVAKGFEQGPAAVVNDIPTRVRKLSNHMFMGPDFSIVHPGIFPHNPAAKKLATLSQWLSFDYKSGWGEEAFEENEAAKQRFPAPWDSQEKRLAAREILGDQFYLLEEAKEKRLELLRNGYKLGEAKALSSNRSGLSFEVPVMNGTDGHNAPTGFTAERLVWLEVIVKDSAGKVVFKSGDLDPNGDVRDGHSSYVHNGELPLDRQLFSLQSLFLTTNERGSERERILAVNRSIDPLPFLRPETSPSVLTGRPFGARIHKRSIPPKGTRLARYQVAAEAISGPGTYSATIRLKAAMVPVNLVSAIQDVGFDYGLSPREVADRIVDGHLILWERTLEMNVN